MQQLKISCPRVNRVARKNISGSNIAHLSFDRPKVCVCICSKYQHVGVQGGGSDSDPAVYHQGNPHLRRRLVQRRALLGQPKRPDTAHQPQWAQDPTCPHAATRYTFSWTLYHMGHVDLPKIYPIDMVCILKLWNCVLLFFVTFITNSYIEWILSTLFTWYSGQLQLDCLASVL